MFKKIGILIVCLVAGMVVFGGVLTGCFLVKGVIAAGPPDLVIEEDTTVDGHMLTSDALSNNAYDGWMAGF